MNEVFVGKHAGRADLYEITRELALEDAVFMTSKVNMVVCTQCSEVGPARVVLVITDAAIAGDAAIHFVVDEGAKILIYMRIFESIIAAFLVP